MYANSHGMSNAFYTHHRLSTLKGRNLVSVYEINNHILFANLNTSFFFPESSHHCVFRFLTQMKCNADSVLWTKRNFKNENSIGRSLPLFVNNECWIYFTNKLQKSKFCPLQFYTKSVILVGTHNFPQPRITSYSSSKQHPYNCCWRK